MKLLNIRFCKARTRGFKIALPDSHTFTEGKMTEDNSFKDAAIEAELETGQREPTRDAAWAQSIKRLFRVSAVGCSLQQRDSS